MTAEERARQVWRELADEAGDFSGRYTGKLIAKYTDALRAHANAALEAAEKACSRIAWTHPNTRLLGPEQNALKCEAAIRALREEE